MLLPEGKPWCGGCAGNGDVGYFIKERSYCIGSSFASGISEMDVLLQSRVKGGIYSVPRAVP
jgi:hypothetical protein